MRVRWQIVGSCLLGAALMAVLGCGSKAGSPPVAINGNGSAPSTSSSDSGAASKPAMPAMPDLHSAHPKVLIDTSMGSVTVELDAEKAPLAVENFLSYADQGFYEQTIFHQVSKDYILVAGGFDEKMAEKHGRQQIRNEAHNGLKNCRGSIAMLRLPDAIDSARSQFFFNLHDNPLLDYQDDKTPQHYGYCVFGQVVAGQEVLDLIGQTEVHTFDHFEQIPVRPVVIKAIRRVF